jgi:dolichol-phosphate mannosyltransferase
LNWTVPVHFAIFPANCATVIQLQEPLDVRGLRAGERQTWRGTDATMNELSPSRVVLVPTYNERGNIVELIERLVAVDPALHVLVIDDASPDGTARLVEETAARYAGLHVLRRADKKGLGPAYTDGFAWAFGRGYKAIAQMDGDLSHQPEQLPALFAALDECDLAVGSRYIRGGAIRNWNFWRRCLSRAGNVYAGWWLRLPFHDITTGFRAWRAGAARRALTAEPLPVHGYAYLAQALYLAHRSGLSIREVPIEFVERNWGKSKLDLAIVWEAIREIPTMRSR